MSMINPLLKKRIRLLAEKHNSKATTLSGQIKFRTKKKIKLAKSWPNAKIIDCKLHIQLDSAKSGDEIEIKKGSGYKLVALDFGFVSGKEKQDRLDEARRRNPRKKNIGCGSAKIYAENAVDREEEFRYKGKFSGYKGSYIYADYQSCAAISPSGITCCVIVGSSFVKRIKVPAGTRFAKDNLGIHVVRASDKMDFHFLPKILLDKDFCAQIRRGLVEKFKSNQKAKKAAKADTQFEKTFQRQIRSTYVSLEDSRRAGNCVEGSIAFAQRKFGSSREDIVGGQWLYTVPAVRVMATQDPRAVRAVRCAWQRETTISI